MPFIQLTGPQTIAMQKALLAAFPQEANFRNVLILANKTLDGVSGVGQPLPTRILEAIKNAEANNWLLDLLSAAVASNEHDETLNSLHDDLKVRVPPPDLSPYYMCRLGGGTVMVDRKPLRAAVEELHDLQGRRIFVIKGESWCGKSHSLQLITFIAQIVGGFTVVPVDLDPRRDDQTRLVLGARDLASRLVSLSGYNITLPEDPTDRQWSRWVTTFGDRFAESAIQERDARWIVIDGMNKVLLDQSAVDLIQDLVNRVHSALARLRLVLVGYEQSLPPLVLPYIQEEQVARISNDDLVEFFVLAYQEMNKPRDEDALAEVVARILNQVDMTSIDYLVKLGPLVAQEVLKIKRGS